MPVQVFCPYHIYLSIGAEKALDKIQHPFMMKTFNKMGIKENHLNIIKATFDKPSANITLKGEKLKALYLRSGTRQYIHSHYSYST